MADAIAGIQRRNGWQWPALQWAKQCDQADRSNPVDIDQLESAWGVRQKRHEHERD